MPKFNDFNLDKWKELEDIETNSLWIIDRRDNTGKHNGSYHGNFIPQIPRQMIKRFTKQDDIVLDAFMGSGTTAYECEILKRNFIGIDIKKEMVDFVKTKLKVSKVNESQNNYAYCIQGDSVDKNIFIQIKKYLTKYNKEKVQHVILHPPYFDILKFSKEEKDLSNSKTLESFISDFGKVVKNCVDLLEKDKYVSIVIGDKYSNSEWIPLGFYCMEEAKKQGLQLKSIIVKNMEGNRAKQNQKSIWRYRALNSDYYIFKHEYILLLKKI
ncbi:MAG: DNA adenine methylase [Alphaproteobacteria bacterium]|nr:DNA adenine methylase [Alphaproteobacteria bacterium]